LQDFLFGFDAGIIFEKVKWYVWKKRKFTFLVFLYVLLSALLNSYKRLHMIVFRGVLIIKACGRSKFYRLVIYALACNRFRLTFGEICKIVNTENPIVILNCFI